VTGDDSVTLRTLSEKHGASWGAIANRSSRENWTEARVKYREERRIKTQSRMSDEEAELRARQAKAGKRLQEVGMAALQQHLVVRNPDGSVTVTLTDPREIRQFIEGGAKMEREAFGIKQRIQLQVEQGFDSVLDKLERVLTREAYEQVLDVLTGMKGDATDEEPEE